MPKCYVCEGIFGGIVDLQRHLRFVHKFDEHASYKCGEANCFQTCTSWSKYRTHLKSFHFFPINCSPSGNHYCKVSASVPVSDQDVMEYESLTDAEPNQSVSVNILNNHQTTSSLKTQVQIQTCLLVGKLYSKPGCPRKLVQEYIDDTSDFLSTTISLVEESVKAELRSHNVTSDVIDSMCEKLSILKEPFVGINTEYLRLNHLKSQGFYIEPVDFNIVPDMFSKVVRGKIAYELGNAKGTFIPLRKSLKAFVELPNVFHTVLQSLQSKPPPGIISNFIHGAHWISKRRQYSVDDIVVPIFVFYDDFEVDKELGPHSAKLGSVYIKLACLPDQFQGSLENIFLALLFNYVDRVDYGNKPVFQKLIDELNYLQEEGIEVAVGDKLVKVYFVMGLLVGDNLGMHTLLGFAESFSAEYSCRFCCVSKSVLHTQCVEEPSLLRDKLEHRKHIETNDVSLSGVKGPSVMDNVKNFEPTENPAVDKMHDVDEGVAVYDMGHILYHLIYVQEYFTVETLNFRMVTLNFCPDVSNRPPQLKEKHVKIKKMKMTASEMRTFLRVLSLLIGDLVDESDQVWKFYLVLRDIYDILLCSYVQEEVSVILKRKIAEHNKMYVELFNDTLKPKHHYMVHYPRIMLLSGCFVHFSCDRFEANHQPSVRDAKGTTSRRFIAHTLAVKEQLRFAHRLQSHRGLDSKFEIGPEKVLCHDLKNCISSSLPLFGTEFTEHTYVCVKGTMYKDGVCVVVGEDDDGGPEFGVVSAVLMNHEGIVGVECDMLCNLSFSDHFHAYLLKNNGVKKFILISDLFDHRPVWCRRGCNGNLYVTLHHIL